MKCAFDGIMTGVWEIIGRLICLRVLDLKKLIDWVYNEEGNLPQGFLCLTTIQDSIPPGDGPSTSTRSTDPRISPLSRKRLPKYLRAVSDSDRILFVSWRLFCSCSKLRCRPMRRLSEGTFNALRTSELIRRAFEFVKSIFANWFASLVPKRRGSD